jgi:hypothetical protein
MKKGIYKHNHSSIFLMEIIIAILFFSVVSAICLNIFVYSQTLSDQTGDLNFAVSQCSSIAEILQAADSPENAVTLLTELKVATSNGHSVILEYDTNYQPCEADTAAYILTVQRMDSSSSLCTWHIEADTISSEPVYALTVEVYYGK